MVKQHWKIISQPEPIPFENIGSMTISQEVNDIFGEAFASCKAAGVQPGPADILESALTLRKGRFIPLMEKLGIMPNTLLAALGQLAVESGRGAKKPAYILLKYCRDLTADAASGHHDPLIGRKFETLRVKQILNRRKKNNPLLVGDSGVGKSSIIEGLAATFDGKRILSLDIHSDRLNPHPLHLQRASDKFAALEKP